MKYAFLVMGDYDCRRDRAEIRNGSTRIVGVSSVEEACETARALQAEGVACIELCGAFGEAGARRVITPRAAPCPWAMWSTSPSRTGCSGPCSADKQNTGAPPVEAARRCFA